MISTDKAGSRNQKNSQSQRGHSKTETPSASPSLSLPKGGGAIRGIGEKFSANPVTGTGSMSIPIAVSPGRSGFGPSLSLSYDSGAGNGPFGFGWHISIPAISRKTNKGLPQYIDIEQDQNTETSDVFILSGTEDLVPLLVKKNGRYRVQRFRPRIEGLFSSIEHWVNVENAADTFWRSITKDNLTTWYGKTPESRIFDPANPTHIFTWLICETHDDKGNVMVYRYKAENSECIDLDQANEKNRTAQSRTANRYLKYIQYGNLTPYTPHTPLPCDWLFEIVFDYGEHHTDAPTSLEAAPWPSRPDSFSSYRSGFEVRTYRLCQRVLMLHHFPNEPEVGQNCLIRSTDFTYAYEKELSHARHPIFSFLLEATQSGYKRLENGGYVKKSLPRLEFEYTQPQICQEIQTLDTTSFENFPSGLDGSRYQWVDLDGEGLSGIFSEQGDQWFYKRNLSGLHALNKEPRESPRATAHFGAVELIAKKPSLAALSASHQQLMDLAGDGQLDLVEFDGPTPGFYERTANKDWNTFVPFTSLPAIDWQQPNLKFIDLTGDGHADIFISENDAFCWHASLAQAGFGRARQVQQVLDEEKGPRLVFSDKTEAIFLADLSGDGLTDLVRIRNGDVSYWPNIGYGRFGAKVRMDNAPWFDIPDLFDQSRLRLADIDGSGVTDIIYLCGDGVHIYFNQSGNGWSQPHRLTAFPAIDHLASIQVVDLLGNGTACLVWSSSLPSETQRALRYVDLMGGQKPHLLAKVINNLGAETHIHYVPSTHFYLKDQYQETPWITKIPFPVQVVESVVTLDRISQNRFVTRYAYHHGYFDGEEREFRGFGLVEQWDTEEYISQASQVPPVRTKTWFHTGASSFQTSAAGGQKTDIILPSDLSFEEEREAYRALKGTLLRQEVYAEDGTEKSAYPYSVTEHHYTLKKIQPRGSNRHAVFFNYPHETISHHTERNPTDPRTQQSMTLKVDAFGNPLKTAVISYGRRQPDLTLSAKDRAKQEAIYITLTENKVTPAIDINDHYRSPQPYELSTYEITGLNLPIDQHRFKLTDILTAENLASLIVYEQNSTTGLLQKRLIEKVRTLYRRNDLTQALPLGDIESQALPFQRYQLAFTEGLLAAVYGERVTENQLITEGGYVHSEEDANWWIPSGRVFFSPNNLNTPEEELAYAHSHFFLPHRLRDPFHTDAIPTESITTYDRYHLLVVETCDALGNLITAGERDENGLITQDGNDYRVLQPKLVMDANRNRAAVAFDALGMVVGTAVMGKLEETLGDSLEGFEADLSEAVILDHLYDPLDNPHVVLNQASTRLMYDLFAYERTKNDAQPLPSALYTLTRETHSSDLNLGENTKIQHSFAYSDGFGRQIAQKTQAEPGNVAASGKESDHFTALRWVGSGWTIFNNKGKPVRQYEPFFSTTHGFEFDVKMGVSPIIFYDPLERVVATLHPNHTYEKIVFDPWQQISYDVNDTVLLNPDTDSDVQGFFRALPKVDFLPTWYQARIHQPLGEPKNNLQRQAALKTAHHANTPTKAYFDSLGRAFLTLNDNGSEGTYATRVELDIEGNQRAVIDAKNRVVMRYQYDLLGVRIHQASMEAGERWMLNDVLGKSIRSWNTQQHAHRVEYDALRRPVRSFVKGIDTNDSTLDILYESEILYESIVYGEAQGDAHNHRGHIYQAFDGSGMVCSDAFDFKGNLRHSTHQLVKDYKNSPNWDQQPMLEKEIFTSYTTYDALNRPIMLVSPDKSLIHHRYNEANLLETLTVNLRGSETATPFIKNIQYNAKGQRERIEYGNGSLTDYIYDEHTFRLSQLKTIRGNRVLQDLNYSYDPVGNITHIRDQAEQSLFFRNLKVEPSNDYVYDAIYRLIQATGREHLGQVGNGCAFGPTPTHSSDQSRVGLLHPHDHHAMGIYQESYEYDEVGNFRHLQHRSADPHQMGWKREYQYLEASLLDSAANNNRLSCTQVGDMTEPYTYDAHGNITQMSHLSTMTWDFKDQLQHVDLGGGGQAYYIYGADGQRVRKVREHLGGLKEERIYLGGFEIYRKTKANEMVLTRETLHLMDGKQRVALVETKTQETKPQACNTQEQNEDSDLLIPLIRYQLSNHLGSAALELDFEGAIISYEEYYPYGSTSYQAGRSITEVNLKRYRYTGKERDEETGFAYHGARYYIPWLGRWISVDPALITGKAGQKIDQSYQYVENRPIIAFDPDGAVIWFAVIGIVAIASLTIVSDANAPENEEQARNAKPSIGEGEFMARTAVVGVSWFAGGAVGSRILLGTGSKVLSGMGGGGAGGLVGAPGDLLMSDIFRGELSSGSEYGSRTASGTLGGILLGGVFGGGSRIISGPAKPPPGGFGWHNVFGVPSMRPGRAADIAETFETQFGERPKGIYVVGSRAEAYKTGQWPDDSSPIKSDIDLVIQAEIPDVTKWTPEGFEFLRAINPGKVPPGITSIGVKPGQALIGSGEGNIPKGGLVDPFIGPPSQLPDLSLGPAIKVWPLPTLPPEVSALAGPLFTHVWQLFSGPPPQKPPVSP